MEGKTLMENLAGAGSSPAHAARSFSGDYSLGKPARAILGSKGLPCVPYQHVTSPPPAPTFPTLVNLREAGGAADAFGLRYTSYPSAAPHLLPTHVFKESLLLPLAPRRSAADPSGGP